MNNYELPIQEHTALQHRERESLMLFSIRKSVMLAVPRGMSLSPITFQKHEIPYPELPHFLLACARV